MNYLLVFDDSDSAHDALRGLCRMVRATDTLTVLATIRVPSSLAEDAPAGMIWQRTCQAEVRLSHAREVAGAYATSGVRIVYMRSQAHRVVTAIVRCAREVDASVVLVPDGKTMYGRLAHRTHTLPTLRRAVPCPVQVITHFASAPANMLVLPFIRHDLRKGA